MANDAPKTKQDLADCLSELLAELYDYERPAHNRVARMQLVAERRGFGQEDWPVKLEEEG